MQKSFALLVVICLIFSCTKDDNNTNTGEFQYTVSGSSQADVSGTNCRFGQGTFSNTFITMVMGTEVLTFNIFLDPLIAGNYAVNAGFVNGTFQPSMPGDVTGELQLGSAFTSNDKFFNTASGDGGRVTVTSIEGNVLRGNFQVNMLELVGGTAGTEPEINITGSFTAKLQQ